ncbi:hypothetical protein Hte_002762 [Hypoxylon texense]
MAPRCEKFDDYDVCDYDMRPDDFCCPVGSSCIFTAANTTLVCCPEHQTCNLITTIPCDITLQNAIIGGDVVTTVFDQPVPPCGDACCPFGYHCNSKQQCQLNEGYNDFPPGAVVSSSQSSSSTQTSTKSPASPTTSQDSPEVAVPLAPEPQQSQAPGSPALSSGEIAAIAIGSAFGIAAVILLLYVIRRTHRSMKARKGGEQKQDASAMYNANLPSTNDSKVVGYQPVEAHSHAIYELGG